MKVANNIANCSKPEDGGRGGGIGACSAGLDVASLRGVRGKKGDAEILGAVERYDGHGCMFKMRTAIGNRFQREHDADKLLKAQFEKSKDPVAYKNAWLQK
eukprot:4552239-Pyramimonas_sp.AAC.1